ncbi:CytoChrome c, class I [Acidisarcina polymorpha]|uniref:CytoChrome c, class I n=1 Tax=Acidisarcina polymorpha TaxID=2211140 RepID=A0A2Z5G1Z6_9BACT|nr:hypothetical protein [Acidisarcina polymorpha]AXC13121.1 CytoChrome c, class I [Acidisarcina polymorpha]
MKKQTATRRFGAFVIGVAVVATATIYNSHRVQANDRQTNEDAQIRRGYEIAPVPLNLKGKNWRAVGLGSYLVNAVGSCNDCHSASVETQFLPGGNPYFNQPTKINPATYLGGGRDFGKLEGPDSPDIISRNLTPDKSGLPEGGHTFEQFLTIMRTGKDYDHLHPNCSSTITTNCLTPPFDGSLLQIMPWPTYHEMTDHDLHAIYDYLSAVPCVESSPDPSNPLHNDCPTE